MLLLSYLYDLSERQTEVYVNDSLSAKCFLGLAVDEVGPDHSTMTAFKRRIMEGGGQQELAGLLEEVVHMALHQGVAFGSIQVVDSTHSIADVNVGKDESRQKKEGEPGRDEDARWGAKHTRRYRDKQGKVAKQTEYFYGYKAHTSMNAEAELITSVVITPGNATDGKQFGQLVSRDAEQGLPIETYAGDRGYDDTENHYRLEMMGLHSALKLNKYRTQKKDGNKEVWQAMVQTDEYQAGQRTGTLQNRAQIWRGQTESRLKAMSIPGPNTVCHSDLPDRHCYGFETHGQTADRDQFQGAGIYWGLNQGRSASLFNKLTKAGQDLAPKTIFTRQPI